VHAGALEPRLHDVVRKDAVLEVDAALHVGLREPPLQAQLVRFPAHGTFGVEHLHRHVVEGRVEEAALGRRREPRPLQRGPPQDWVDERERDGQEQESEDEGGHGFGAVCRLSVE